MATLSVYEYKDELYKVKLLLVIWIREQSMQMIFILLGKLQIVKNRGATNWQS